MAIHGGGSLYGPPGVYGTLGVPAPGNLPGGRSGQIGWTDSKGNFWIFGGTGYDSAGTLGELSDLWKFNPSTNEWAWMNGINMTSAGDNSLFGTCGTLGVFAAGNLPGYQKYEPTWVDSDGNLWMLADGGITYILWEFSPSLNEWAWMGGSCAPSSSSAWQGVYGKESVPNPANHPGTRFGGIGWVDGSGNFWLYGGYGSDAVGNFGNLDDMWQFNPSTQEWTWMNGLSILPTVPDLLSGGVDTICHLPVFGTPGVPAPDTSPGCGGQAVAAWVDNSQNLWLFGSADCVDSYCQHQYADVWEFDPLSAGWAWMAGTTEAYLDDVGWPADYGTLGVPAISNLPGYRTGATAWTDSSGNFWLFGGLGNPNSFTYANDLWEDQPPPSVMPASVPTFSPAPGTYTSPQAVTISGATDGATIYFTTDGTSPTTSSTVYSRPLTVSSSETLEANATATGFSTSAIATAAYTINLPPPDFSVVSSRASMTVTAGQSGTISISITPANGFNSAVSFACSGLPAGASCSFSPATITPSGASIPTTLTIATSATTVALQNRKRPLVPIAPIAALAGWLVFLGFGKRRHLRMFVFLTVSAAGLTVLSACGGAGSGSGGSGSHPVTSTITVTATSGSLQHTATISLTVN